MNMRTFSGIAALALGVACGGDSSSGNVTLGVMASNAAATAAGGAAPNVTTTLNAGSLTLSDATHTLTLTSVEVILSEIRVEDHDHHGSCDESGDQKGCERVDAGPMFLSLPLDGSVQQQLTLQLPAGTYDRIKFRIDNLNNDSTDIITAHPEMADLSIRAVGTFDGTAFIFTSSLNAEQEVDLTAPLVVATGGAAVGVTLSIDVSQWFTDANGNLIDPTDAHNDSNISNAIENNVDTSFGCFGDDNMDGKADGQDDHGNDANNPGNTDATDDKGGAAGGNAAADPGTDNRGGKDG